MANSGETEWTKNGRCTGITDLELTATGVAQVTATGSQLVGPGKLIDPARVAQVWVSPRKRAQQTFQLLFQDQVADRVALTEDIAELDYGDYEGLKIVEIRALRKDQGWDQDREWNLWQDWCEGGE